MHKKIGNIGVKIGGELREHFRYPDPVSAGVEERYYALGLKLPKDFTRFVSRRDLCENSRRRNLTG